MILIPRKAQREFDRGTERHRICAFLTRRQFGKTTNASRISLKKMMRIPNHTVVFGSLKLDLGREIIRKEAAIIQGTISALAAEVKDKALLDVFAGENSVMALKPDDFAELYEAQRLEFRLYHSRTTYSRTKVVALSVDAVGETGDLILDEIGRVKNFRAVWEAVKPIISSNPEFRCILTTTPPPDDTHFSFELLAPPPDFNPPANANGNWYRSELGVPVLRVTAWDAEADNVHLYDDDTGAPITPEQSRRADPDKDGWDRNYAVKFVIGGSAACDLLRLQVAQERGAERGCQNFVIDDDGDFLAAKKWLAEKLAGDKLSPPRRMGIGFDVATTTKGTSNPSVVSLMTEEGPEVTVLCRFVWKTKDPGVATDRLDQIIDTCIDAGIRPKALAQDATNEKYYAEDNRKHFRRKLPVVLVVASEGVDRPGLDKPTNYKEWLGDALVGKLDDNNLTVPPGRYTREDYRLVMKDRGKFVCEPNERGMHGDTFDGDKLALFALGGSASRTTPADYEKLAAQAGQPGATKWPPYSCEPPDIAEMNTL